MRSVQKAHFTLDITTYSLDTALFLRVLAYSTFMFIFLKPTGQNEDILVLHISQGRKQKPPWLTVLNVRGQHF